MNVSQFYVGIRSQKRATNSLELESGVVMSHPTWVLRTELRFSGRAEAFNHPLQPKALQASSKDPKHNDNRTLPFLCGPGKP